MKRIISITLAVFMLALCLATVFPMGISAATDRTGWTAISSASDFASITSGTSGSPKKYYLTKNIEVNATINPGWNGAAISYMELDGAGYTITLSKPLFNRLGEGVTIHDLDLKGKISWGSSGGFMKSPLTSGNSGSTTTVVTITNVTSDVDMEVSFNNRYKRFAGIIHLTSAGSALTNVKYTGSITVMPTSAGDAKIEDVGGLVGTATSTTFTNCTNEADILIMSGVTPGNTNEGSPLSGSVAGIAGETSKCTFINCTNSGDIKVDGCPYYTAGGIAGTVSGVTTMTDCTNTGDITAYACASGFAGCNPFRIEKSGCRNTGVIKQNFLKVDAVKGSCNEMGIEEHYTCSACGAIYGAGGEKLSISDVVGDYDHDLGELIPEKKADCQNAGMKAHYRCEDCDSYFDEDKEETLEFFLITEAGHTCVKVPKGDATCFYPKVLAEHYFCTVCEKYFDMDMQEIDEDDVIEGEALGHGYGELIAEQPATETAEGMKAHYECSRCHALFDTEKNEVEREALVIPALESEEPKEPEGNKPEENEPNENEGGSAEKPTEKPTDKPTDKPTETEAPSGTLPADGEKSGCSSLLGGASVLVAVALIGSAAVMIKRKED